MELLESKTKDLPTYEARQMKKRLAEATTVEIEKNFSKILESVKDEMKKESKEEETTLEAEVKDIIEAEEVEEDDMLTKTPHNGNGVHSGHIKEAEDDEKKVEEKEEEFETMESVKFNNEGEVELDESEIISADELKMWSSIAAKIK